MSDHQHGTNRVRLLVITDAGTRQHELPADIEFEPDLAALRDALVEHQQISASVRRIRTIHSDEGGWRGRLVDADTGHGIGGYAIARDGLLQ